MKEKKFSWKETALAFGYAYQGIKGFIINERNAKLHVLATVLLIVASFLFHVSSSEAIALTAMVGFVWVTEMINSCFEKALDFISVERRMEIKYIKDMAAGAVLIASVTALITGLIIFLPKIIKS